MIKEIAFGLSPFGQGTAIRIQTDNEVTVGELLDIISYSCDLIKDCGEADDELKELLSYHLDSLESSDPSTWN